MKPSTPVAIALDRMPLAAMTLKGMSQGRCYHCQNVYLAFLVSSAIWPDASNPVKVPAVKRLSMDLVDLLDESRDR